MHGTSQISVSEDPPADGRLHILHDDIHAYLQVRPKGRVDLDRERGTVRNLGQIHRVALI